jgi:iron(III) transport system ATP-binding protein
MANVKLQNISKAFGKTQVLDNISLEIKTGELFFLLGPSGCGKTTLLRIIAGFHRPDQGRVFFDDQDMTEFPPHQRNTGMVFQHYALWPHLSVSENLSFGLKMHGLTAAERDIRVKKVLQMIQLEPFANRSPNQLSGGQQQRVALGRALVLEPDLVLLDEPLSNLDAKLRLEMREQILELHQRLALTMIYVTHDQSEALSLADQVAIMHQGKIQQVGTPRQIYTHPANAFIANFIGETNFIKGRVRTVQREIEIETEVGLIYARKNSMDIKVGDQVHCSIRPERLSILDPAIIFQNSFSGVIERLIYQGNHEQYFLRLADGTLLQVLEYNIEFAKAEVGKMARAGCGTDDVDILKQEA